MYDFHTTLTPHLHVQQFTYTTPRQEVMSSGESFPAMESYRETRIPMGGMYAPQYPEAYHQRDARVSMGGGAPVSYMSAGRECLCMYVYVYVYIEMHVYLWGGTSFLPERWS
jgi:hypothetical protein